MAAAAAAWAAFVKASRQDAGLRAAESRAPQLDPPVLLRYTWDDDGTPTSFLSDRIGFATHALGTFSPLSNFCDFFVNFYWFSWRVSMPIPQNHPFPPVFSN